MLRNLFAKHEFDERYAGNAVCIVVVFFAESETIISILTCQNLIILVNLIRAQIVRLGGTQWVAKFFFLRRLYGSLNFFLYETMCV